MVKKLLSEKEKRMIRMIQALPWVGCWRIAKMKCAVRRRNQQIVQVDEANAAFDSINLTEPSESLSSAELFEKKQIRWLALKWNDNEQKWNSYRASNQPVPASVFAFRSLTSVKMSAENYFHQNPKKQVLVFSAEQLYELDDGSYYDVRYPADLPVEEISKICDDCEAMLLPCIPYDGELKFSQMVGAPEVPKDGTTSKKRKKMKNSLEIAASKSVKLQNSEKETLFSVGSSEDQNLVSDFNILVEPEPHEDLNAAKLSDVELRDKKRIRWRALKWRKNEHKWWVANSLRLQVSAKVAAIKADTKLKEDAENFFIENPPKKFHVISAEHLFQLDAGENYQVLFDGNLHTDEVNKIRDFCNALLLPCEIYLGGPDDLYHR